MSTTILSTNHDWGFFGTTQRNYNFSDEATARLFDATGQMLRKELKLPVEQIKEFLDGRYGRHFADELSFYGAKEGMTEKAYVGVVRKFLKSSNERRSWVVKEISNTPVEMSV